MVRAWVWLSGKMVLLAEFWEYVLLLAVVCFLENSVLFAML